MKYEQAAEIVAANLDALSLILREKKRRDGRSQLDRLKIILR